MPLMCYVAGIFDAAPEKRYRGASQIADELTNERPAKSGCSPWLPSRGCNSNFLESYAGKLVTAWNKGGGVSWR